MQSKKQAFDLIKSICHLNETVWSNSAGSYDDATEAAYQIEEALEGMYNLENLYEVISEFTDTSGITPKELSRSIVYLANGGRSVANIEAVDPDISDVDRFDKALDAIYFAIGSMHKLGLRPEQIVDGLQVVHTANLQKSGVKDSQGKVGKPENFQSPEPLLQKILDKR